MISQEKKEPKINHILTLTILWLLGAVSDRLWFAFDKSVPAWDQADYLTGSLTYWRAFQNVQLFSGEWWQHFWELSPKVPPLTYILTVPFQVTFGRGADQATLVNLFFSVILLASVYSLGKKLFNQKVGFWAAVLCILFPGLYRYRLQYLLDYPLTAMVTLSFCCLTFWYWDREQGIGNREQRRGNRQQATGNRENQTGKIDKEKFNFNSEKTSIFDKLLSKISAIGNREQGTGNRENQTGKIDKEKFNFNSEKTSIFDKLLSKISAIGNREQGMENREWKIGKIDKTKFDFSSEKTSIFDKLLSKISAIANHLLISLTLKDWLLATAFGLAFGAAILVKQTTIFFLFIPLLSIGVNILRKRQWQKLIQLIFSLCLSVAVFYPWARTNWLLMLTAGKRATVDSAIAEGDPNLLSLDAWLYYWKLLPYHISLPLLIIPIGGLFFYFIRSFKKQDKFSSNYLHSCRWLAIFLIGGYLICSLNINKDFRYTLPLLPVLSILLAFGLMQFPRKVGKQIRWFTIGLAIILMVLNLWPVGGIFFRKISAWLSPGGVYYAHLGKEWPHQKVIAEIIKTDPYLRSTLGVLPSTPEINQHNLNYYGALQNLQVYGRQVGTNLKQVPQDVRSLSWFVTKTNDQGSVKRIKKAQAAIVNTIEQNPNFQLQKSWLLPDNSNLNLYHNQFLPVEVHPLTKPQEKIKLDYVILSPKIRPGVPIPITYKWSGSWQELQSGLVLLTYRRENIAIPTVTKYIYNPPKSPLERGTLNVPPLERGAKGGYKTVSHRFKNCCINPPKFQQLVSDNISEKSITSFIHDRAIGMGSLYPGVSPANKSEVGFEIIERIGMLPPANISSGNYILEATYLNRKTGETYPIPIQPPVRVEVDPQAEILPAPELDLVTQLRMWGQKLPLGIKGLETVFEEVGRVNQYDPVQDYTTQAEKTLSYRLQQDPNNLELLYGLSLARVLQQDADGAIAALTRVTELDSQNPFAYAYLAFVYLYNLNPGPAAIALKSALELDPTQPEIRALNGVTALMQGNVIKAWRYLK
ncbi:MULTISPECIES: phospholipid carrier-dependent glycosyltransferase [Okeania]|uniref:phospholipid carrier-dependent glycosyltransferase n=2 Tax=Microcoleaceae TaxID=1892252 RepID=UPI001EFFC7A3|nr:MULTISPECIES: phospholipid carrier-dependent glycosyltransferase [Okeania]